MLINRIKEYLEQAEFLRIQLNVAEISLYYKMVSDTVYAVALLDFDFGTELSKEGYSHTKNQIINFFSEKGHRDIQMLSLFCGRDIEYMKKFCMEDDLNWIIDTSTHTLMLFENQENVFLGLQKVLEDILEGSRFSLVEDKRSNVRHSSYFSPCNIFLLLANVAVFLFTGFRAGGHYGNLAYDAGALDGSLVMKGEFYRLLTYMFLHSGVDHIVNNMIILAFVGNKLEQAIGKYKFVLIYFLSGILAGAVSIGYNMSKDIYIRSVGASGAIFGLVGAVTYIVLVNKGRLEDISRQQIFIFAALSLYGGFIQQGVDNAAHIGGFIAGIILSALLYHKPKKKEINKK